jgi:ABC-type lipoprotein export system ATPase subunit
VDALELAQVWKSYPQAAGEELHALRDVSLRVPEGRVVAITGRSGSGKSTLLHLAAGIDAPTRGSVCVLGRELGRLGDRERSLRRRDEIGLVFQFFHLLAHLDVRENVALPAMIAGRRDLGERVDALLERVGLTGRAHAPVGQLSGGEMQRVAICRALLHRPRLLLADEPTGNLDDHTGRVVMELLLELVAEHASALVYVTHSPEMAALAHERWEIRSGVLEQP